MHYLEVVVGVYIGVLRSVLVSGDEAILRIEREECSLVDVGGESNLNREGKETGTLRCCPIVLAVDGWDTGGLEAERGVDSRRGAFNCCCVSGQNSSLGTRKQELVSLVASNGEIFFGYYTVSM